MEQDLTLREALAAERLDDFVRQEEARGVELVSGAEPLLKLCCYALLMKRQASRLAATASINASILLH
jgi:hypothetical protein